MRARARCMDESESDQTKKKRNEKIVNEQINRDKLPSHETSAKGQIAKEYK